MNNYLLIFLFSSLLGCAPAVKSPPMANKDCYSPENFGRVKEYIAESISRSSMGTNFYLEFPVDSTRLNDRVKRPSNHPENVYDVLVDKRLDEVVCKSKRHVLRFQATGLVTQTSSPETQVLAAALFCHLVNGSLK